LARRIAPALDTLERAIATGRCVLMSEGSFKTAAYPSEAAQAADMAVGLLLSGTAALEAWLAGVPTVMLDPDGLPTAAVSCAGAERSVFSSVQSLLDAIDQWRRDPGSRPGLGDLGRWAESRDPYHDGMASERIGSFLGSLRSALQSGLGPQDALGGAVEAHVARWGEDAAVWWRQHREGGEMSTMERARCRGSA
jgi:hypothetical protein